MRNSIITAITLGIFGGIILFLQQFVSATYIQPRNPDNILFFEYGITVLAAQLVVYRNDQKVNFLNLFFTGCICTFTIMGILLVQASQPSFSSTFNLDRITGFLMVAIGANMVIALVISNLNLKPTVKTNPEVLDDLDY